jgi:hypothetical protein
MKDSGCDHHTLPFMCGGCDIAFLNRCLNDYQAVSLWKWRREGALNPDTFMQHVITFDRKHLTPLDLHPVQVIRIMLIDGYYHFGERWGKPVGKLHLLTYYIAMPCCLCQPVWLAFNTVPSFTFATLTHCIMVKRR